MSDQALPHDPNCVFCKILAGSIPAHEVYSDDQVFAFLDIQPLADGHAMVIPRGHWRLIEDMPAAEAAHLFQAVQRVSAAVREATGALSTTVGINNGPEAGQVVPHVHAHIVPRHSGDGGGSVHSIVHAARGEDLAEMATKIRERMG